MTAAQALGDAGAARAARHADDVKVGWSRAAQELFDLFLILRGAQPFLIEDVRAFAEDCGLAQPPDNRAWGAVAKARAKAGDITSVGYSAAQTRRSHGGPRMLWRSAK